MSAPGRGHFWISIFLLWLAGNGLRLTILAVPPVIALIQADLYLSGTQVGILNGLPIILFAAAALPGSLLIARLGALRTLVIGLVVTGLGSALRGALPSIEVLYLGTIVMGAGVAIMQPSLPPLVRQWLPNRIGFGTALYTNGLLVGETLPVALTIPLVLPLFDGSWRASFALWGLPLIVIAALTLLLAPRPQTATTAVQAPARWWPDWNNLLIWKLGAIFGSINAVYFCTNAFVPGHLTAAGRADLIAPTLTALNLGQVPASFLMLAIAGRLQAKAWPFIVAGVLILGSVIGIALTASAWTIAFAALLGFLGAAYLTLGLTLPPLLSAPGDVARMSAAMFTISYTGAVVISVASGAAWDLTGSPVFAFVPIALSALPPIILTHTIKFPQTR